MSSGPEGYAKAKLKRMDKRDYYETLGIARDASDDQIKRAHRQKAKQYHPDHHKGDKSAETKFKEVQEAYEVLKDPQKRKMYDQFGHTGFNPNTRAGEWRTAPGGQRVYTWSGGQGEPSGFDVEDILRNFGFGGGADQNFSETFSGRGRRRRASAEPPVDLDVTTEAAISFDQAVHGTTLQLSLADPAGEQQTLDVKIPAGVREGQTIRLAGKGSIGPNGQRGDVLIKVHVGEHAYFRRDDFDIYLDVPISISEAVLGTKIDVPTLDGHSTVTIPPGTAGGSKLRLMNQGAPNPKTKQRGHQYLVIQIIPPKNLTDGQKENFSKWSQSIPYHPRENCPWYMK